ncbi:MAG TPA: phage holin family protein [Longimicrobiales bacterium]
MERERGIQREARPDGDAALPLGDLLRRLAGDTGALVRQQANLAKLEMKEAAAAMARDGVKLAVGIGLLAAGGLALAACVILLLGRLFNGAYWAGALIVGAVLVIIGAIVAARAVSDLRKRDVTPEETIESLQEDKRWLQREARDFREAVA